MSHGEKFIPGEGINLEISPFYLGNTRARFIRNLDLVTIGSKDKEGSNTLVHKPLQATALYDSRFTLPSPEGNVSVGRIPCEKTNALYCFTWNKDGRHAFYRIREGACQLVFTGPELNLSLRPENFIDPTRFQARKVCIGEKEITFVRFTDGAGDLRFMCIEDSIATNSFNPTLFPIFAGMRRRENLISLAIPAPTGCIQIKPVADPTQKLNENKFQTHQFRLQEIDVYGRPSELGVISDQFYQPDCLAENVNCLDLVFDPGGPMTQKINVLVRRGNTTEWMQHKTLTIRADCEKPWYEREIKSDKDFSYDPETNKITYRYCGPGQCIIVPDTQSQRDGNPVPHTSESLFSLGGSTALAGNTYGFKPFDCDLLKLINFEIERPDPDADTVALSRNIVLWFSIHNPYNGATQAIWKKDSQSVFGGTGPGARVDPDLVGEYGQYFSDPLQEGFLVYLAGTNYSAVSEQYVRGDDGQWKKWGAAVSAEEARNNSWIQRVEFKSVRPGIYIARLASHLSKITDPHYQRTSTYVAGQGITNGIDPNYNRVNEIREIFVDVREKNYDTFEDKKILLVWDLTNASISARSRNVEGYVYETYDNDGNGSVPIEEATIVSTANSERRVYTTDHNGFYFVSSRDADYNVRIFILRKCLWQMVGLHGSHRRPGRDVLSFFATDKWATFTKELCNRIRIKGRIVDCNTGAGLPGITVGLTQGSFATSNDDGFYEIIAHDREANRANGGHTKQGTLVYLSTGNCAVQTCNGNQTIPPHNYSQPVCGDCNERPWLVADVSLQISVLNQRGLQMGGQYGFGVRAGDWKDSKNFAQAVVTLKIPTVNETRSFKFSRIKWSIDPAARFPLWVDKLYLLFGANQAFSEFLSWVADRIEFIDNTGAINDISPTQVKIWYSSLNEYNKQKNFSTNTTWQFLDGDKKLRVTDIAHFVANGDGKIFDKVITELVRFDQEGRFFLVDYRSELKDLKDGALIKFIRPSECVDTEKYFEVCQTIDVIDGVAQTTNGILNAYDSYLASRQIPTPIVTTRKVKKVVQDGNPVIYEEVDISETSNILKPYGWSFEHHSPSDQWGTKCNNRGRFTVANPYENIVCKRGEVALSGVLGTNGIINFLHYFDDKRKTDFEEDMLGAITGVVADLNRMVVICDTGNYVVGYDDNSIQASSHGAGLELRSLDKEFGKPQRVPGDHYGCAKFDRNTISFLKEIIWLNAQQACLVKHDYSRAVEISGDFASFLRQKVKSVKKFNKTAVLPRFFHGSINPNDGRYYLTDYGLGKHDIINDSDSPRVGENETLCVSLADGILRQFVSFTPEGYGWLQGDLDEKQFFSFVNGLPHAHYRFGNEIFNTFYGVKCQRYISIALGKEPGLEKDCASVAVYTDNVLLYAKKVTTSGGQTSWIPRNWFDRGDKFWVAPFLCDLNTLSDPTIEIKDVLFDGDLLKGKWIEILFAGDPDRLDKYSELEGFEIFVNGLEKLDGT